MSQTESVSLHIGAKPSIWDHVFIVVAEFIGTATLLFLSCMGTTMGIQGDISTMQVSFNTGLAVMAVIQMFGHISGAHVNPVVTMSAFILNEITLVQVPLYVISQIFGSLAGVGLQVMVTPRRYIDVTGHGVCVPTPHSDITHLQAFGVEILLTTILIFSICACWDRRNSDKLDSVALRIGLVVGVLNLAAAAYTGASMNPVRTFGPAVWGNDYNAHWVYWIAPTIGSLIATFTYKYIFLRKK
ncbi:aquaporin AQPAe.a-like isoform X2 [Anoplophora glabripennis]|uniref:aquaporin AQPAe.a-like isoform X2 n=1 Tax=Anoplophora glabripennis TaxID=217634 RepID=UPI00087371D4|nr:aquaporin AQPAe.a-like isoform X2 [Anoplophora glabripennis]